MSKEDEVEKSQPKNEFIQVLPSRISIEGYVRLKLRCACCKQRFGSDPDAEYRKEDLKEILQSKPLCPNCAKHLKEWQKQREGLEGELAIEKSVSKAMQGNIDIYEEVNNALKEKLATAKQDAEKWKDLNELAEKRSADLFKRIWEAQKILTQWGGTRFAESLVEKLRTVLALPEEETEK